MRVFVSEFLPESLSLLGRQNLNVIEETLRKQWRLGQNIALCWSFNRRGILVLFVPHYFLGNYCALDGSTEHTNLSDNEIFIRQLISGTREYVREEFFAIAERLGVAPTFIRPENPIQDEPAFHSALDNLVQRYGLSFVDRRAVLLFDIAGFSLYTPFEQASQLNSLSYSMNSAYNKLQSVGIDVPFRRTTTGDGYYVWHRDQSEQASRDLLYFLLLIVADNAAARAAAQGNTVPCIRAAYHIGAHYELYQAEGVNPTVFSYIVGDATIELARMLEGAKPEQILIGEFSATGQEGALGTRAFIDEALSGCGTLLGVRLAGQQIQRLDFGLSSNQLGHAERLTIQDKHGLEHYAYNLECMVLTAEHKQLLGAPMTAGT